MKVITSASYKDVQFLEQMFQDIVFYQMSNVCYNQLRSQLMKKIGPESAVTKIQAAIIMIIIIGTVAPAAYFYSLTNTDARSYSLNVTNRPASFGETLYTIPNQKCLFMVTIAENQTRQESKPVTISATAPNCQVTVYPPTITSSEVAEVTVVPTETDSGKNVTLTIHGERDGYTQTKTVTFEVIPEESREETLNPEAVNIRNNFAQWLSTNRPELDITNKTAWTGTVVNPRVLVVMHYMFISEEWEMYVTWHVMIPPYDWARIYLRQRYNHTAPTYAFEISSIQEHTQPQAIEVPDWV
jgi:hypothetical protein